MRIPTWNNVECHIYPLGTEDWTPDVLSGLTNIVLPLGAASDLIVYASGAEYYLRMNANPQNIKVPIDPTMKFKPWTKQGAIGDYRHLAIDSSGFPVRYSITANTQGGDN